MTTRMMSTILLLSMGFMACKKESATQPKTTQEKLAGKWTYVSSVAIIVFGTPPQTITDIGAIGDYIDFRNDGKVYSLTNGSRDTSAYGIISDSKMWIGNANTVYDMKVFTDSDLQIYHKETYSAANYTETTVTMKR